MKYNIIIKLGDNQFKTEIEAENWEMLCDYVFGNIEVIDEKEV